jgi:hypothetical protein
MPLSVARGEVPSDASVGVFRTGLAMGFAVRGAAVWSSRVDKIRGWRHAYAGILPPPLSPILLEVLHGRS